MFTSRSPFAVILFALSLTFGSSLFITASAKSDNAEVSKPDMKNGRLTSEDYRRMLNAK